MAFEKARNRPNFLIVVADDLGFSDCSCFGSEIQTPNIDALAQEGIRFTQFHVAAACSPTRSMLMTGTDHHIAGLGQLAEFVRSSTAHQGQPGHEGYLNDRVVALPELLRDGGYHTIMAGKWHLGMQREHFPFSRGFTRSFALLPGCANHYGYEPQYQDYQNEPVKFLEPMVRALHVEDSEYVEKLPDNFYSSDAYVDKLIDYLESRDGAEAEKPFFAYLPFAAPHWPLQAPRENMDKYRGAYSQGPDALRQKRLEKLKELGLVPPQVKPHPIVSTSIDAGRWEDQDDETQAKSSRAMEAYAGMVDRLDWNIGRIVDYLKKTGEFDNTFILFMSDNGAEGASYEARPIIGPDVLAHIAKYYDNSLENIGTKTSFVWYGPYWAQAATAPSRLYKMHSTEGGCRVPLIVRLPKAHAGNAKVTDAFCTVMDVVPTILELAGLEYPDQYNGRPIVPLRGKSWNPFLSSLMSPDDPKVSDMTKPFIHGKDYAVGFEIAGSGALIRGDWKITFVPAPRGPQRWELFNLSMDPGETSDLSQSEPKVFSEMMALWEDYKKEVGVVGLVGDYPKVIPGATQDKMQDQFEDPYIWIKYIGRSELAPDSIQAKVPK